eukprot:Nk52_evm19s78 gene=Nk52_evmTU19s78
MSEHYASSEQYVVDRYVPGLNKQRKILSPHEKLMLQKRRNAHSEGKKAGVHPSGRIIVAVRVRPPFREEVERHDWEQVIAVSPNSDKGEDYILVECDDHQKEFFCDYAFDPRVSQGEVYDTIAQPIVENAVKGFNGALLCYGQTGSGKTYTLGILHRLLKDNPDSVSHSQYANHDPGIIPRSLWKVFEYKNATPAKRIQVTITCVQLYCETIQNLLNIDQSNMSIRQNPQKGFYIDELEETLVNSYEEAVDVVNAGLENRVMATTLMNATSSRSHTILTVTITQDISVQKTGDVGNEPNSRDLYGMHKKPSKVMKGKITFVDLAGSERVSKTRSEGQRLDEAKAINVSLTMLGNVIAALVEKKHHHIPFRSSKLTTLLQESLGGNSHTSVIVTVDMNRINRRESLFSLLFAQRCTKVQTHAIVNEEMDDRAKILELESRLNNIEMEYKAKESMLVEQYDNMLSQLKQDLIQKEKDIAELQESRPGRVSKVPSTNSNASGSPSASRKQVMAYCYEVICDLYSRTCDLIDDAHQRHRQYSQEWIKNVEGLEEGDEQWRSASRENILEATSPATKRKSGENHKLSPFAEVMASASRSVLSKYPPAHRAINSKGATEPVRVEYPPLREIIGDEKLILWIRKVHAAMAGNLHYLDEVYKQKDNAENGLKLEAVRFEIFKYRHDEELQNWSNTLKQLLSANGKLMEARQYERAHVDM